MNEKLENILTSRCGCKREQLCGGCFWKGITKKPNEWKDNICIKCQNDMNNFKDMIKNTITTHIIFNVSCCKNCIWWNWFHSRRVALANRKNITFEYKKW